MADRLVSHSATSFEFSLAENTSTASFAFPTLQQQAAIDELKDIDESDVIAWLTVIRSIEPGFCSHEAGPLSSQQLNALASLRECRDSNILVWLRCLDLADGKDNPSYGHSRNALRSSTASSLRQGRRPSNKSTPRSSTTSLVSSIHSSNTSYSTPRSSLGYGSSLPDLPEGLPGVEQHGHVHWCHECDKVVNTCDGWKRHMKEHETWYLCMPAGPVENTPDGPKCTFCGYQNPDQHHSAGHCTSICTGNSKGVARKSRKALMVDHLALHRVFDTAASDLADKWQCTRKRRAFACGFCVKPFSTLTEQLNHIDNEHFKHGQDKLEWNINTVIKGLLHQPRVKKPWQKLLASDAPLLEDKFRWNSPAAEALQSKLEAGEEAGSSLALTAFGSSIYDSQPSIHHASPASTLPLLQTMAPDAGIMETQVPDVCHTNSRTVSADAAKQTGSLISRYHPGIMTRTEINTIEQSHSFNQDTAHPFGKDNSLGSDFFGERSSSLQAPAFDSNSYQSQIPWEPHHYPTEAGIIDSEISFGQHAQLQGHLNEDGDLVAAQLSFYNPDLSSSFASYDIPLSPSQAGLDGFEYTDTSNPPAGSWTDGGNLTRPYDFNSREKPLPALPLSHKKSRKQLDKGRPKSPMDIDVG